MKAIRSVSVGSIIDASRWFVDAAVAIAKPRGSRERREKLSEIGKAVTRTRRRKAALPKGSSDDSGGADLVLHAAEVGINKLLRRESASPSSPSGSDRSAPAAPVAPATPTASAASPSTVAPTQSGASPGRRV